MYEGLEGWGNIKSGTSGLMILKSMKLYRIIQSNQSKCRKLYPGISDKFKLVGLQMHLNNRGEEYGRT